MMDGEFRISERISDTSSVMEAALLPNEDSITSFAPSDFSADLARARVEEKKIRAGGSVVAASVAVLGAFLFGYSMGFTSPTLTAMEVLKNDPAFSDAKLTELGDDTVVVTSAQAAQFSSMINIGAMVGSVLGGLACDALGRKGTILLVAPVFAGMWAWTALNDPTSYPELLTARIAVGLAVGVVSMAVPLYISETAPTNLRGTLGSVNQFALTIGILASYVVGIAVTTDQTTAIECTEYNGDDGSSSSSSSPSSSSSSSSSSSISLNGGSTMTGKTCDDFVNGWECHSEGNVDEGNGDVNGYCSGELPHWRVLAWVAAFVAMLLFVLMLAMPETPNWLLKNKQMRRARRALLFLRSQSDLHVDFEMKELERLLAAEGMGGGGSGMHQRRSHQQRRSSRVSSSAAAPRHDRFSGPGEQYNPISGGGGQQQQEQQQQPGRLPSRRSMNDDEGGDGDGSDGGGNNSSRTFSTGFETSNGSGGAGTYFGYGVLCGDDMQRPMIMALTMMVFQQLSGVNAIIFFSGQILQAAGMDNANLGASIVMAVQVCFTGVAVVLMDRAGRRLLMAVSAAGMALAALAVAAFFANHKQPGWLALAALILYIASFSLGMGPVPWLFMGEVFPAHARSKACSAATLVNWSMGFLVTFSFDKAQVALTPAGCFVFFAAVCAACFLFVVTAMPETKGKSFEQIQAEFYEAGQKSARAGAVSAAIYDLERRKSFDVR